MSAITLALIGGFVLWRVGPSGNEAAAPVATSAVQREARSGATPVAGRAADGAVSVTTRGGMAELYVERAAEARRAPPTLYVLDYQERAQAVRSSIDIENAFRAISAGRRWLSR